MPPLILLAAAAAAQPAPAEQIRARDANFFALFFTGPCDAARFRTFITDDVEFYHDKAGFNVHKAQDFIDIFTKDCTRRQNPREWRSRRELVPASLHVDPIPGWGAMQTGEHLFYEREGVNGAEKLAGRARFAQVWVLGQDGQWRVSRVLSYDHGPAAETAPAPLNADSPVARRAAKNHFPTACPMG
jgi:hypothetical protein